MLVWLSGLDGGVYCGFGFVLHLVAGFDARFGGVFMYWISLGWVGYWF